MHKSSPTAISSQTVGSPLDLHLFHHAPLALEPSASLPRWAKKMVILLCVVSATTMSSRFGSSMVLNLTCGPRYPSRASNYEAHSWIPKEAARSLLWQIGNIHPPIHFPTECGYGEDIMDPLDCPVEDLLCNSLCGGLVVHTPIFNGGALQVVPVMGFLMSGQNGGRRMVWARRWSGVFHALQERKRAWNLWSACGIVV